MNFLAAHRHRCRATWLFATFASFGAQLLCANLALAQYPQYPQDRPASLPPSMPLTPPNASFGQPAAPPPGVPGQPGSQPPTQLNSRQPSNSSGQLVVDVIIEGNTTAKDYEIQKHIHTRKDREFDADILQSDVRRLVTSGMFRDVKTYTEQVPGGVIVRFKVFERPRIGEIKFLGNRGYSDKKLTKEIGIKKHDPLNTYAAEESRRKIEELYHSNGFPKATVTIFEGDKPGDKDLIFLINEGHLERISGVSFEGNTISPDGVLKTKIQSKPGYFWYLFGGKVDRSKIDADVQTLTAYYRALGYFRARVSRTLDYDDEGKWLALKFIIDEGPRYSVRNVAVEGGSIFATDPLLKFLDLKSGEFYNQGKSNKDVNTLNDLYGSQGHVFADVQADLRFLEEPGQLDVVYRIKEGDVFKVSEVNVHIAGEFPHTKQTVVLSRVSQRPGDTIDIREVRNSERRLKASQLFAGTQNDGEPPRINIRPPDLNSVNTVRGQEPDTTTTNPAPRPRIAAQPSVPNQPALPPSAAAVAPQAVQTLKPCIYSWNGPIPVPAPAPPPAAPSYYQPTTLR
ncbi:MAG TPA: POTRA domain-containing protein [Pirellulaceae bacterium]|jgi:outer membrane protein insertion porin family